MPSENSITTTEPLRGARTKRPATARDPRPSFLSTTCTVFSLARSIGESTVTFLRRVFRENGPADPIFKKHAKIFSRVCESTTRAERPAPGRCGSGLVGEDRGKAKERTAQGEWPELDRLGALWTVVCVGRERELRFTRETVPTVEGEPHPECSFARIT